MYDADYGALIARSIAVARVGRCDFFMEHWVKYGSPIHQTHIAACMSREILTKRDVAAAKPLRTDSVVAAAPGGRRRGI